MTARARVTMSRCGQPPDSSQTTRPSAWTSIRVPAWRKVEPRVRMSVANAAEAPSARLSIASSSARRSAALLIGDVRCQRLQERPVSCLGQCRLDALGPERLLAQAHADRVIDGIADYRCCRTGGRLAATRGHELRAVVHQHHLDAVRDLVETQDRIARPIAAGDVRVVEGHFLVQRATDRLDHVALDLVLHAVWADDQAVVVRDDDAHDPD